MLQEAVNLNQTYMAGMKENQCRYSSISFTKLQSLCISATSIALRWRHNERDGVSEYQSHDCLLNRLFTRRSKKTSKLRVTGLCEGNSTVTGEFPTQRANNKENISIWWCHHECSYMLSVVSNMATLVFALHCGNYHYTKILHCYTVSLHPVLTATCCEIEIRAHNPRLHAPIVMKYCNNFFTCALYIILVFSATEKVHSFGVPLLLHTEWNVTS